MFVRLHDQLVELPTAVEKNEIEGRIAFTDGSGNIVAWFDKLDILSFSESAEPLHMEFRLGVGAVHSSNGTGDGS